MGLMIRGTPPLLVKLTFEDDDQRASTFRELYDELNAALTALASQRRKQALRETRIWARTAAERVGHRVTKTQEATVIKSASADKGHRGELTNQAAADAGLIEWGGIWHSTDIDFGDAITEQIRRIYENKDGDDFDEIIPPHHGRQRPPQ